MLTRGARSVLCALVLAAAVCTGCASAGSAAGHRPRAADGRLTGAPISSAGAAADPCAPALAEASTFGSGLRLVADADVTQAQLRAYLAARVHARILTGDMSAVSAAEICVIDGDLDPPLPTLPGATQAPVSRVSMLIVAGRARLLQVGSPRTIPDSIEVGGPSAAPSS